MKKLSCGLVLVVFSVSCVLAWAMLTLMCDIRNAGRVLPDFTNLCIALRPMLVVLPVAGTAFYFWLWLHNEHKPSHWMSFVVATMTVMIVFVLPAISTSYLLMINQVRIATGAH